MRFFKLTLLSDIVLQKSANTQGKNQSRDCISGAVFLGIVAKHYDDFAKPFDIFHSGAVRFGEAKPFINGKIAYKTPLCFFRPKEAMQKTTQKNSSEVYNALFCDLGSEALQKKQLKQIRVSYINADLQIANLATNYTQKVNLHAKDNDGNNSMFGYESITKGAEFGFCVRFDSSVEKDTIDKITQILQGLHFIGKSKNAEYGEVKIEVMEDFSEIPADSHSVLNTDSHSDSNEVFLYVASPLALFDNDTAMPTFSLNAQNLGLESAQILWHKTHLQTQIHTPYNQKRKAKDSARLSISQGSVITLTNLSESDKAKLKNGRFFAGGFLSEGYGEMLINPNFLMHGQGAKSFALQDGKIDFVSDFATQDFIAQDLQKDSDLIAYLSDLRDLQTHEVENANAVDNFIADNKDKFIKVTNAQWGSIRAFTQMVDEDKLAEHIKEYINEERLKEKWSDGREVLENFVSKHDKDAFALLATRMPKANNKAQNAESTQK
ncbi:hypothetical protein [Helicobacter sp. T3_23-1056]